MSSSLPVSDSLDPQVLESAAGLVHRSAAAPVLIVGEEGFYQARVAQLLVCGFLCLSPNEGTACGECRACKSLEHETCPDILRVAPEGAGGRIRLQQIVPVQNSSESSSGLPPIRSFLQAPPVIGRRKVVLMERVERLTPDSANALLRMIEEPPTHARFVMWTTQLSQMLPTVRSRCLLLPCRIVAPEEADDAWHLSGGSPELAEKLRAAPELREALNGFLEAVAAAKWREGLRLTDELGEIVSAVADAGLADAKNQRACQGALLQLLANGLMARAREGDSRALELAEAALRAHRLVDGNVRFEYAMDAMFLSGLRSSRALR
ncbi:MAG: hypothetical protein D6724_01455 [Armatimonadetes bacterium]|nr:MAG: hypothetical protein D6724_01455 [Armatimonadota bacterium]